MPPTGAAARPTSLTVFGVLNLFFALFHLWGGLTNLMLFTAPAELASSNPVYEIVRSGPAFAWIVTRIIVSGIQGGALGLGGLGLLTGKSFGRLATLGYAIGTIAFMVVAIILDWLLIMIPLREMLEPGDPILIGAISGMFGNVMSMVYPACALYFLNRKNVRIFFEAVPVEDFA